MRDSKEIKSFYKRYFMAICRFIDRYIENIDDAADLSQDIFLILYKKWGEFKTEDNARYFLYTTARNSALNYIKHNKVKSNFQERLIQYYNEEEKVFLEEVIRQETLRSLYQAIEKLPPQTRKVTLCTLEGDTNQEIGDKLGISINSVKTLKKNAYQTLRQLLSKEYILFISFLFNDLL